MDELGVGAEGACRFKAMSGLVTTIRAALNEAMAGFGADLRCPARCIR